MDDSEAQSEVEEVPRLIAPMIIKPSAPEIGDSIYVHNQYGLVPSPSRNPAARIIDRQGTVLINRQGGCVVFSDHDAPSLMKTVSIVGSPYPTSVSVVSNYTVICWEPCTLLGWCVDVSVSTCNTNCYCLSCYKPLSGINLQISASVYGSKVADDCYSFAETTWDKEELCHSFPSELSTSAVYNEHMTQIGASIATAENEECGGRSTYQIAPVLAVKGDWRDEGLLATGNKYSMVKEEKAILTEIKDGETLPLSVMSGILSAQIIASFEARYTYSARYKTSQYDGTGTIYKSQTQTAGITSSTDVIYSVGQSRFMFCPFLAGPRNLRFWCKLDKPTIKDGINKSGVSHDEMFRFPVTMSISMWKMELETPKNGLFNYKTIPSSVPASVRDAITVSEFKRVKQIGSTNVSASSEPGKPVFYKDVTVPMPGEGIYMFFVSVGPGDDNPWIYHGELSKHKCVVKDYSHDDLNIWSDQETYPGSIGINDDRYYDLVGCSHTFDKKVESTEISVQVSQGYSVYVTQTPPYSSGS